MGAEAKGSGLSGRRRRGGGPSPIGEALSTFLEERGLLQKIEDRRLFGAWEEIVGATLAREARPLRVEKETLVIGASSSAHASQLMYLRPWVLKRIKEMYPGSRIRSIRIVNRPDEGREDR
ncbi:MAG: DUF721 domain-containing protein [Candidatus Eisenbacteria bacterium]|nr:DUF721 domain-containing protein [Candidatus Eisenbacteria bacterium]